MVAMATSEQQTPALYDITDGPSVHLLLAALAGRDAVTFVFHGEAVVVRVNGLLAEDGSKLNWFIRGYRGKGNMPIHWYYNCSLRKGRELSD